jgi:hypothetical protein
MERNSFVFFLLCFPFFHFVTYTKLLFGPVNDDEFLRGSLTRLPPFVAVANQTFAATRQVVGTSDILTEAHRGVSSEWTVGQPFHPRQRLASFLAFVAPS